MKLKHLALLAALMMAGQSWALTAYEKQHGCNNDGEGCAGGGGAGQGGGGGNQTSAYTGAWIYEGSLWESFEDDQGGFDIETNMSTGKKTVHMGNAGAFLIKPPPPHHEMKRSSLVYGAMAPAQTLAQAKKKAEEEKAKKALAEAAAKKAAEDKAIADAAAAKKAAEAKAVAEAIQKAGGAGAYSAGLGAPASAKPAGGGVVAGTPAIGVQPAAGAITARKKP